MQALREAGVGTGVHYPAVHTFTYYRSLGWRDGMFPHAERIGRGILTLPLYPSLTEGDVGRIVTSLAEACQRLLS
jgi:dTDP-4-amino-4,6-dideoxygalactose transaminase